MINRFKLNFKGDVMTMVIICNASSKLTQGSYVSKEAVLTICKLDGEKLQDGEAPNSARLLGSFHTWFNKTASTFDYHIYSCW
jgi:hypothetical protein